MKITEYSLAMPGAPSLTMVLAADLHCRGYDDALAALTEIRPDLVVSSGDMMHNCIDFRADESFNLPGLEFLTKAAEVAPLYLSVGNHERAMMPENRTILAEREITLLDNEWIRANGMVIGGLSSPLRLRYRRMDPTPEPDMEMLSGFAAEEGFHVLLNHHPEYWPDLICGTGIQLTLSGHAHGGQWHLFHRDIFAPGQGMFPKYASGLHRSEAGEILIVSRGMANTVPMVPRFGNPTELVVIHLSGEEV